MNRFEFTGQQKGKQIANIITSCRIVLSGCLLFCQVFSGYFWIMYLICGFTDMVDGTIARRTNTVTDTPTAKARWVLMYIHFQIYSKAYKTNEFP